MTINLLAAFRTLVTAECIRFLRPTDALAAAIYARAYHECLAALRGDSLGLAGASRRRAAAWLERHGYQLAARRMIS